MNKKNSLSDNARANGMANHRLGGLVAAIAAICCGIFFIVFGNSDRAVSGEEAAAYTGGFEKYGYTVVGIIACAAGVLLIVYIIASTYLKRKEEERQALRDAKYTDSETASAALRYADPEAKSRILLEAEVGGYNICYRRVKSVNELVINGLVYDEKKGIAEVEHELCALIDGHAIEAGYDEDGFSYISFDDEIVKQKKRSI